MNTFFYLVRGEDNQLEILDRKAEDYRDARVHGNLDWSMGEILALFPAHRFQVAIQMLQAMRFTNGHYYALLARNMEFYDLGKVDNFDRVELEREALVRHASTYEQDAHVFTAQEAAEILRLGTYALQCYEQEKQDAGTGTSGESS